MSLLETVLGFRGQIQGYQDKARNKILQPVQQEAFGRAAAAMNLPTGDVGAIATLARADPEAAASLLMKAAATRSPEGRQARELGQLEIAGQEFANTAAKNRAEASQYEAPLAQQQLATAQQGYTQAAQLFPLQMQQAQAAIDAHRASLASSKVGASVKQLSLFNTIRGQYQALPAIKTVTEAQSAYKAAAQAAQQGGSLGARVALIKLAKLADPTSVVREGEVENIRQGTGALSQLNNQLQQLGGKGMTPEMRAQFMDVMDALYAPALELGAAATAQYREYEKQNGARPGEFTNSTGIDWTLVPGAWRDQQGSGGRGLIQRQKAWPATSP